MIPRSYALHLSALGGVFSARICWGQQAQGVPRKRNKWLEFMKKKGRGPWVNLLHKSEVLTLLLEIHGLPTVFILITSIPPSEGTSPRLSFSTGCT